MTAVVGSSIILTLGAANYYGPGDATFATTGQRLKDVSDDIKTGEGENGLRLVLLYVPEGAARLTVWV